MTTPIWAPSKDLIEVMNEDPEIMADLVTTFIADSTARLSKLRDASRRDHTEVTRGAHSLKGSALQLGANALAVRCGELEHSAAGTPEQCDQMIDAIYHEFALASEAMDKYLAGGTVVDGAAEKPIA